MKEKMCLNCKNSKYFSNGLIECFIYDDLFYEENNCGLWEEEQ